MNYQESFNKLINEYGLEVLKDNTLTYNYLSDMVGSSFSDTSYVNAFYVLNKDDLYSNIKELNLNEAKKYIKELISESQNNFTIEQYIRSVEPLLTLLYPNEYVPYSHKVAVKPEAKVPKQTPKQAYNPVNALLRAIKPRIDKLTINAVCESLTVSIYSGKEVRVCKDKKDVTNAFANGASVDIQDSSGTYVIDIPKQDVDTVNIVYLGTKLSIASKTSKRFTVRTLNIHSNKGDTYIDGNIHNLNITQSDGDTYLIGKIDALNIDGGFSNVSYALNKGIPKRVNIHVSHGSININLMGKTISPKINHLLFPVRSAYKTCLVGKKKVIFNLLTDRGRINVR